MNKRINNAITSIYEKKGAVLLGVVVVGLFIFESRYSLRKRKSSRIKRVITNAEVAATAAIGFRYFLIPSIVWAAMKSEEKKIGILYHLPVNNLIRNIAGFLILDYGNYLWHRMSHHFPFLWRFHQVHHSDLDLDVSTAFRFHVGEILPSTIFRAAVVCLSGISWRWVLYYEIAFEAANNFHHSNLKLPEKLAESLTDYIVTPAMHGIHHSIIRDETDSNYSVIFSCWDRLHQSLNLDIPQEEINIGVPAFRSEKDLGIINLMLMPFKKPVKWELPDGTSPKRIRN